MPEYNTVRDLLEAISALDDDDRAREVDDNVRLLSPFLDCLAQSLEQNWRPGDIDVQQEMQEEIVTLLAANGLMAVFPGAVTPAGNCCYFFVLAGYGPEAVRIVPQLGPDLRRYPRYCGPTYLVLPACFVVVCKHEGLSWVKDAIAEYIEYEQGPFISIQAPSIINDTYDPGTFNDPADLLFNRRLRIEVRLPGEPDPVIDPLVDYVVLRSGRITLFVIAD